MLSVKAAIMAVVILPDAQEDLLTLQEYMLDKWGEAEWLKVDWFADASAMTSTCMPAIDG